ncbi:hypothetical protein ACGFNX_03960 [Streptomyces sp. NPDC048723]|uniref:hypothetical protein n=1 Tax=Streptomyces sp. NPDC048723 TaxID=3365589 RepID=UPI0037111863
MAARVPTRQTIAAVLATTAALDKWGAGTGAVAAANVNTGSCPARTAEGQS